MRTKSPPPQKPRSELIDPDLASLPALTPVRRAARFILIGLLRLLVWLFIRPQVSGLENVPRQGPYLVVSNHLGDADLVVGAVFSPVPIEIVAKAELHRFLLIGWLMDIYGVIWIHRGQPDRRALRAVIEGLRQGRIFAIAPEGRESLTGSLEQGTDGAAYLALRANVPLLPVTFTNTENARVYQNMKRLKRTPITMTVGKTFWLDERPDRKQSLRDGTQKIMEKLAMQLPPDYQGIYRSPGTH
jgi:1-acyl-sn-glycerol-3-phosphate acyltransferase